ncbi:hypothetical protein DSO57_1009828 [Entomophthora muscae]|uniref:Uncharacterized protein n=1 Tax=Entomophthora muscae TaxID=34485 RepID=A0ACC2TTS4_9FUNG|nr:hypothetical protein DSO57_1009828 [Entomophthora muscae]
MMGEGVPPACQAFVSAEGRYHLIEDIVLGDPLTSGSLGSSISLLSMKFKEPKPPGKSSKEGSTASKSNETLTTADAASDRDSVSKPSPPPASGPILPLIPAAPPTSDLSRSTESINEGFALFAPGPRRRSKATVAKTNSSLVARIIAHEQLPERLLQATTKATYVFYASGRTFLWADLQTPKEALSQIVFNRASVTCHDVNPLTRSRDRLDVILGLSSGDIVWFNPLSSKYVRMNKLGVINSTAVTSIKWVPGSETQVLASHLDGSLILYDKDKDDQSFTPSIPPPNTLFNVTRPSAKTNAKHNPQVHWQVSTKSISSFAFSPDFQLVAVVSLDGGLRVIDFTEEILLDVYSSYFGGLTCVCWSPDRKYILTGGQDDLVTIWSNQEQRIIARCQGHKSWVTGVAFDPWRCDEANYRFGSVGEDMQLLLWDFSPQALPKPKMRIRRGSQSVHSVYSTLTPGDKQVLMPTLHPLIPRNQVVMLQPLMSVSVHSDPLCNLVFREDAIITTCRRGHIKIWGRPPLQVI